MIKTNMHEAKSRLSELVKAAERGEEVLICRNGQVAARLTAVQPRSVRRDLIPPDPKLKATFAPGYDPTEPLSEEEWPEDLK